ncbi:DUF4238 domain-containing protein [Streptomyces diastatochromogenes]|nr:DUF4238 domain-containing protein [Streptomyces diastatochromogenes]
MFHDVFNSACADGEGWKTQVVRLAQQSSNTARINTIAAENHFHRFTVDDEETLCVEETATKIEGHAAQPLLRLVDPQKREWPLPNDERLSLAFFIAFQFMCVPVARDPYASMVDLAGGSREIVWKLLVRPSGVSPATARASVRPS